MNGELNPICDANLKAITQAFKADLNELKGNIIQEIEHKWGKVKERDEKLEGKINTLDALIRTQLSANMGRMERIEHYLWEGETSSETRLRKVETTQAWSWGKIVGVALGAGGGISLLMWGIHMLLLYFKVFPPGR